MLTHYNQCWVRSTKKAEEDATFYLLKEIPLCNFYPYLKLKSSVFVRMAQGSVADPDQDRVGVVPFWSDPDQDVLDRIRIRGY
jgi:hypothetical protein